ncbi:hypothetical protein Tco_0501985 [Tanacetum coccineum]
MTGFTGEKIWPLGETRFTVMIGNKGALQQILDEFHGDSDHIAITLALLEDQGSTAIRRVSNLRHTSAKFPAWHELSPFTTLPHRYRMQHKVYYLGLAIQHSYGSNKRVVAGGCAWTSPSLTKHIHQDCYPLPEVDWKWSLYGGYPQSVFLVAYTGVSPTSKWPRMTRNKTELANKS